MSTHITKRPRTMQLHQAIQSHPGNSTTWYACYVSRPAPSIRRDLKLLESEGLIFRSPAAGSSFTWTVKKEQQ
jgi:predicted transcriptional regulator